VVARKKHGYPIDGAGRMLSLARSERFVPQSEATVREAMMLRYRKYSAASKHCRGTKLHNNEFKFTRDTNIAYSVWGLSAERPMSLASWNR
jgi:hypothetical protein